MSRISLTNAHICMDCDSILDHAAPCECSSRAVYPLARFLNREAPPLKPTIQNYDMFALPTHTCVDRPNLPCDACEGLGVLTR